MVVGPFILTFSIAVGITTYVLTFSVFLKRKSATERSFLVFLSCFLLIMFISTVLYYAQPVLAKPGVLLFLLLLIARLTAAGLMLSAVYLVHRLVGYPETRSYRIGFVCAAGLFIVVFLALFIHAYSRGVYSSEQFKTFEAGDVLIYVASLYPIVLFIVRYRSIENLMLRKVIRSFVIIAAVFLPVVVLDDFNVSLALDIGESAAVQIEFLFFPVLYIAFNTLLLYYGFQFYVRGAGREVPADDGVSDAFVERFGITPRERELLELLIEGKTNKEIGEALFISPATVRNHLHNVFEKTGVSSRTELVRLCTR